MGDDVLVVAGRQFRIEVPSGADFLWRYETEGMSCAVAPPVFELDGAPVTAGLDTISRVGDPRQLTNGVVEHVFRGNVAEDPSLTLDLVFRVADDDPVIRFRYVVRSEGVRRMTKSTGRDRISYLGLSFADVPSVAELRLSEWNDLIHGYTLVERAVGAKEFEHQMHMVGPVLVGDGGSGSVLVAYEHGATAPDSFLTFALCPDRRVELRAVKGNYCRDQVVSESYPYETVWMELAAVPGDRDALAAAYHGFALEHLSENAESRTPYIFYNTWNYQERNRHWNGRPYLESMNEERMLQEIDVAHRLGVEVFVIDTGWYGKTGDWRVSRVRFPNGLRPITEKLDRYGMKLGLWFNPTVAAASSDILKRHEDCISSWRGKRSEPGPIWETEESHHMCLVSRYADAFVAESIRLHGELGVTYFKWDAVDQHGCDDPHHDHGGPEQSEEERENCYAFRLGPAMMDIARRIREACPGAIVDFDVTEAGRFVGLAWLSESKYYLVNNGPYYATYNLPIPPDQNWNMFFYPGPARAWICRASLEYDRWIPSVLFMTHYLPDEPESSQLINFASLILGQNGVWGDLVGLSEEAVARFGGLMARYKQVRDDITNSYPVRSGPLGGTPEVHEKISETTGRGAVCIFSGQAGRHIYVTQNTVAETWWHTDGVSVEIDESGRARLEADFTESGAQVVLFGVR